MSGAAGSDPLDLHVVSSEFTRGNEDRQGQTVVAEDPPGNCCPDAQRGFAAARSRHPAGRPSEGSPEHVARALSIWIERWRCFGQNVGHPQAGRAAVGLTGPTRGRGPSLANAFADRGMTSATKSRSAGPGAEDRALAPTQVQTRARRLDARDAADRRHSQGTVLPAGRLTGAAVEKLLLSAYKIDRRSDLRASNTAPEDVILSRGRRSWGCHAAASPTRRRTMVGEDMCRGLLEQIVRCRPPSARR